MRALAFILATALVTLSHARPAAACSCIAPPPVAEALQKSTAVFAGRIVSVSRPSADAGNVVAKFSVSKAWKGVQGKTIEVSTSSSGASCGLSFKQGDERLIYANAHDGTLWASLCSRSARLADAKDDVAQLDAGPPPAAPSTPPDPTPAAPGSSPPFAEPPPTNDPASPAPSSPTPAPAPPTEPAPTDNAPPPLPPGSGGCACATAPAPAATTSWGFLATLAAAAAVGLRRRGRSPRSTSAPTRTG
ncbi:MYXO-CTERM sorting domain-containing protein [Chondromyces apiculatus]|uniref:MYXO-CTERM sorting domain-containing protein n=1 Tax=Chondromyces apiculatus TaxID=51 RepID=UPI0005C612C8|nr:MYXO-CTERM sorting domain-containing protein [Chondromyces apiculatus]